jgi:ribosomal protein S18 acetylase RimI-like enzyme
MNPLKITVRNFNPEDYKQVIQLWANSDIPYRPEGRDSQEKIMAQITSGTSIFLVAEINGGIVRSVLGTHDGRKGWINRLVVDVSFRRQNIAKTLIKELEGKFEQIGLEVFAFLIERGNSISMDFFHELGYIEWNGRYYSKRKSGKS